MNIAPISLASISNTAPAASTAAPKSDLFMDFGATLEKLGTQVVDGLQAAESNSMAALSGNGSTRNVVDAVMSAEQSLQVAVGIRDKIVSAYLELSRMAI